MEGNGPCLILDTVPSLIWPTEGNDDKIVRFVCLQAEIKNRDIPNANQECKPPSRDARTYCNEHFDSLEIFVIL